MAQDIGKEKKKVDGRARRGNDEPPVSPYLLRRIRALDEVKRREDRRHGLASTDDATSQPAPAKTR